MNVNINISDSDIICAGFIRVVMHLSWQCIDLSLGGLSLGLRLN